MSSICSAELIELGNAIKQELVDEEAAYKEYTEMATKFTHLREKKKAELLQLLAGQEILHKVVLEAIVDEIELRCTRIITPMSVIEESEKKLLK